MRRDLLIAICLALVVVTVGVFGCDGGYVLPESPIPENSGVILSQQNTGIWVTGEGKVTVVPDVAILNLGVEAQATTVAKAQSEAAEAMEAVVNELNENGVDEKDIKTQHFSIYPVRSWKDDKEILIGYRVSNMVTAKIRKVEDTGSIIDAVAKAGGDYIRINSIGFTVDDPTAYHEEVREKAMADAKAKAEELAKLGKVKLGKPTYISEGSISLPVPSDFFREAGAGTAPAATTPISPGETEISLTVQVVYGIE